MNKQDRRLRKPFRTLGLSMLNFGRKLFRAYAPPHETSAEARHIPPPAWQMETQSPLIWPQPEQETPDLQQVTDEYADAASEPIPAPRSRRQPPIQRPSPPTPPTTPARPQPTSANAQLERRLQAILQRHQDLEAERDQIREQKRAQLLGTDEPVQRRQAAEGEPHPRYRRRRGQLSVDYVETSTLMPHSDAPEVAQRRADPLGQRAAEPPKPEPRYELPTFGDADEHAETEQFFPADTHFPQFAQQPADASQPGDPVTPPASGGMAHTPLVQRETDDGEIDDTPSFAEVGDTGSSGRAPVQSMVSPKPLQREGEFDRAEDTIWTPETTEESSVDAGDNFAPAHAQPPVQHIQRAQTETFDTAADDESFDTEVDADTGRWAEQPDDNQYEEIITGDVAVAADEYNPPSIPHVSPDVRRTPPVQRFADDSVISDQAGLQESENRSEITAPSYSATPPDEGWSQVTDDDTEAPPSSPESLAAPSGQPASSPTLPIQRMDDASLIKNETFAAYDEPAFAEDTIHTGGMAQPNDDLHASAPDYGDVYDDDADIQPDPMNRATWELDADEDTVSLDTYTGTYDAPSPAVPAHSMDAVPVHIQREHETFADDQVIDTPSEYAAEWMKTDEYPVSHDVYTIRHEPQPEDEPFAEADTVPDHKVAPDVPRPVQRTADQTQDTTIDEVDWTQPAEYTDEKAYVLDSLDDSSEYPDDTLPLDAETLAAAGYASDDEFSPGLTYYPPAVENVPSVENLPSAKRVPVTGRVPQAPVQRQEEADWSEYNTTDEQGEDLPAMDVYDALYAAGAVPPPSQSDAVYGKTQYTEPNSPQPVQRAADDSLDADDDVEQSLDVYNALVAAGAVTGRSSDRSIARQFDTDDDEPAVPSRVRSVEDELFELLKMPPDTSSSRDTRTQQTPPPVSKPLPQAEVSYPAPPPQVMRAIEPNPEPPVSQTETDEKGSGESDINIDQLARDVYSRLRNRLRIEKERGGRR